MGNIGGVREVIIEDEIVNFQFKDKESIVKELTLVAGFDYLIKTFFKHEFPTEGEIEKALNYVEYELTKQKELVNKEEKLCCSHSVLTELLKEFDKKEISKEEVETVFDKYVDCATGEPAHLLQIDFTLTKFSVIFIIRSIMYYLNFEKVALC